MSGWRVCGLLGACAVGGVVLAAVGGALVFTFGPESLLHLGEATYDDRGQHVGVR
jgi:hypothetical protein